MRDAPSGRSGNGGAGTAPPPEPFGSQVPTTRASRTAPDDRTADPAAPDSPRRTRRRPGRAITTVKSLGVVFFRSGGDGGQGGATVDAVGAVVGLEHVGQAAQ